MTEFAHRPTCLRQDGRIVMPPGQVVPWLSLHWKRPSFVDLQNNMDITASMAEYSAIIPKMSLSRPPDLAELKKRRAYFPATAILGPRQCGKTTLARELGADHFFDLESSRDLAAFDSPQSLLETLSGLVVIDEVQRRPDLFPVLRHLIDTRPDTKYLLLGSASPDLARKSSESLAGRIAYYPLGGFRISEVEEGSWRSLWLRGGFPRSFLAPDDETSDTWRESYVANFLGR